MCIRDSGNSVTSIGNTAFYECSSLTSITIPDGVKSIGKNTFYNCSKLTSITIPNSVISIEDSAFYNCSSLTSITIGNSVTSIGNGAFDSCSSLTSITIKTTEDITNSVKTDAFVNCPITELIYETTGFSILTFDYFKDTVKLVKFNIPKSNSNSMIRLQEIKSLPTLTHFTKLDKVTIENINELTIPESFIEGDNFEILITNNIKSIDPNAFKDCSINKFTYLGTDKLENDFLKNAKSCEEVITSTKYSDNEIGGMTITHKQSEENPNQPGENPNQPGENPNQPGENPSQPGENPNQPGENPSQPGENTDDPSKSKENKAIKGGEIAGIIIGSLIGICLVVAICFGVYYYFMRIKPKNKNDDNEGNQEDTIANGTNEVTNEKVLATFDEQPNNESDSNGLDSAEV